MSDFQSFVRAIIHAPSDRTVQLVFADWLDQYTGEAEWARRLRVGPADPELPDRPREIDWRWEETVTLDVPTPGAVRSDFLGSLSTSPGMRRMFHEDEFALPPEIPLGHVAGDA